MDRKPAPEFRKQVKRMQIIKRECQTKHIAKFLQTVRDTSWFDCLPAKCSLMHVTNLSLREAKLSKI